MAAGALLSWTCGGLAQAQTAQYPLAGQWVCQSTPVRLAAHPPLPELMLHQRYAYAANAVGQWSSNSAMDFVASNGQRYHVRTQAQGQSTYKDQTITQTLRRFEVRAPYDTSSALAKTQGNRINNLIVQVVRQQPVSAYRLVQQQPGQFALRPLGRNGQPTSVTLTCRRAT